LPPGHLPIRSYLAVPVVSREGDVIGGLFFGHSHPGVFTEQVEQLVIGIASQSAIMIENARLYAQIKERETALREFNATLEQRVEKRTAELQRSNRELDQFAYVASHDLKAPLRAINHLTSWIAEDANEFLPEISREHLSKLQGRVRRMETLLDDMLAYSRAGRQRHPAEQVNTTALISDVIEILAPPPGFTVRISGNLPVMRVERIPLETVFRNLIGNAIKHHHRPTEGNVEISAQEQEHFVEFTIKDDGPGIDPGFHQRIFEMFQTLKPRDLVEGSGVGLAVVKKSIESRGGTIQVESSLGEGATFRFTWPHTVTSHMDHG
jgi:signal transduction histidine kinase